MDSSKRNPEIDELRAYIEQLRDFIEHAPVSTGVCCCGDEVEKHGSWDHRPVDQWEYTSTGILAKIPRQSLNEVKAEAVYKALISLANEYAPYGLRHRYTAFDVEAHCRAQANMYSRQIKNGER